MPKIETFDGDPVGIWAPKNTSSRQLRVSAGRLLGHRVGWIRQYQFIRGIDDWQATRLSIAIDIDGLDTVIAALVKVKEAHLADRADRDKNIAARKLARAEEEASHADG